ncbi:hypothetical protein ACFVP3_36905 [Streptomyces sp. NPDC057806]|uniref:hypothetical protein n=1 Tax=Streptomyces sp. NPDC057806 TaxID=3346255 RepID=UPI00369160A8
MRPTRETPTLRRRRAPRLAAERLPGIPAAPEPKPAQLAGRRALGAGLAAPGL